MREERQRPNGTPAGSCTPCSPSGKEEEVYSGIARTAAAIRQQACQSSEPEAEGRKNEIRAPAWEGGGLSQPSQGAWGLGQQADWQGGAAFDPGHFSQSSSSDSGWHCVSRSAGASPRGEARLSPERWAASAGKTPFPLLQAAEH